MNKGGAVLGAVGPWECGGWLCECSRSLCSGSLGEKWSTIRRQCWAQWISAMSGPLSGKDARSIWMLGQTQQQFTMRSGVCSKALAQCRQRSRYINPPAEAA